MFDLPVSDKFQPNCPSKKSLFFPAVNQRGKIIKAVDVVVWPKVGAVNNKMDETIIC